MHPDLHFIKSLAKKTGKIILQGQTKIIKVKQNEKLDTLTSSDIEADEFIVNSIKNKYPDHNIISEEREDIQQQSDYTWIIDPVDGTKYLLANSPLYNISIGLWYKNKPLMGVIYWPALKRCHWAKQGGGAFLNNKKIKVSTVDILSKAIIALDNPGQHDLRGKQRELFNKRLIKISENFFRFRAYGLGTLSLTLVAQGYADAYFDLSGKEPIVDLGAGLIIVQEAGAKITDLKGKSPGMNANHIVITNGKIHNQVLKLLQ